MKFIKKMLSNQRCTNWWT